MEKELFLLVPDLTLVCFRIYLLVSLQSLCSRLTFSDESLPTVEDAAGFKASPSNKTTHNTQPKNGAIVVFA